MSVRHSLLALLSERPMYGYQLRQEFERRTGATWPLNVGQVYTTLARLQRDGLVVELARETGDAEVPGSVTYGLTDAGRVEADAWWRAPVPRDAPARDELVIKVALAVSVPGVDVTAILQRQRTESMRVMQEYTRLARQGGDTPDDDAWLLVLDGLRFTVEAELRWLDHVEARLAHRPTVAPSVPLPAAGTPAAVAPAPVAALEDEAVGR